MKTSYFVTLVSLKRSKKYIPIWLEIERKRCALSRITQEDNKKIKDNILKLY